MKKTIKQLILFYYGFYVLAVVLVTLAYLFFATNNPLIAEQSTAETAITSVYILFLICSIPLALKLFNVKVKKLSELASPEEKIIQYKNYSVFRLVVIGVNMLIGIGFFYLFNSDSMLFCAGIAAIALVFCKPSEAKMISELEFEDV